MKPCPIQAWVCDGCGEVYVDDIEAAEECCLDDDPQFGPVLHQRAQRDNRPKLHLVR
jgi:hypothetical protein